MNSLMYETKDGTNITVVVKGKPAYVYEMEDVLFCKKDGKYRAWHFFSSLAIICKDSSTAPLKDGKTLYEAVGNWLSEEMEKTLVSLSQTTTARCAEHQEFRRKRLACALRAWNFEPPIKEENQ